mmetsp:Transcript_31829/g.95282  ORF Transcript_31829/g.95282 Transcript_31829/m.95282 type:complete len:100 (+) Transcript_31829:767-1066(+)
MRLLNGGLISSVFIFLLLTLGSYALSLSDWHCGVALHFYKHIIINIDQEAEQDVRRPSQWRKESNLVTPHYHENKTEKRGLDKLDTSLLFYNLLCPIGA